MHEYRNIEQEEVKGSSNKSLGLTFGVLFAVLALLPLVRGREPHLWLLAASAVFFFLAMVFPDALTLFNRAWTKFGLILHSIVTPVLMGLVFFGVITPMAIIMKLFGKKPLVLTRSGQASYWIEREPMKAESFKQQF